MLSREKLILPLLLSAPLALAGQQAPGEAGAGDDEIEVVVVTGVRLPGILALDGSEVSQPGVDNGDLLRLFPGGNRNSNGPGS